MVQLHGASKTPSLFAVPAAMLANRLDTWLIECLLVCRGRLNEANTEKRHSNCARLTFLALYFAAIFLYYRQKQRWRRRS